MPYLPHARMGAAMQGTPLGLACPLRLESPPFLSYPCLTPRPPSSPHLHEHRQAVGQHLRVRLHSLHLTQLV